MTPTDQQKNTNSIATRRPATKPRQEKMFHQLKTRLMKSGRFRKGEAERPAFVLGDRFAGRPFAGLTGRPLRWESAKAES